MEGYSLAEAGYSYGGMRVIAFANEKGGVAKTTSCVNLAAALAHRGHSVLCMDMDPQANATLALGFDSDAVEAQSHLLLMDPRFPLERLIVESKVPNLELVPSCSNMNMCNKTLVAEVGREVRLRNKLLDHAKSVFTKKYDYVMIDCSPSLDLITVNVLMAATDMVVPVQAKFYSLQGMSLLAETVASLYEQLDPRVKTLGILVTLFDRGTALDNAMYALLKEKIEAEYGDFMFRTVIGKNIAVSETEARATPIVLSDPSAPAAKAYDAVADELLERLARSN
ncbi:MAG: ParA family protein [Armatimonadota bacterium]|nr:MAG: ParA family protein [Armatimonadota bacterium]